MSIEDPGMPSGGPVRTTDMGEIGLDQLEEVLRDCLGRLNDAGIPYVITGGLAVTTLARPRWTHDIDVFLRPRDAVAALSVLEDAGYEVERTDHEWLFKAWRDGLMVDLVFRSSGHIYFDDEMEERAVEREFLGVRMPVIAPEDLLVVKAASNSELTHYHWFDALALLGRHDIDWDHLLWRSRTHQRHVLSLLVYADAVDIDVPTWVIQRLSQRVYGDRSVRTSADAAGDAGSRPPNRLETDLRQRLRHHPSTCDLDIAVRLEDGTLVVTGEVETEERCDEITAAVAQLMPGTDVRNDVTVQRISDTPSVEVVS